MVSLYLQDIYLNVERTAYCGMFSQEILHKKCNKYRFIYNTLLNISYIKTIIYCRYLNIFIMMCRTNVLAWFILNQLKCIVKLIFYKATYAIRLTFCLACFRRSIQKARNYYTAVVLLTIWIIFFYFRRKNI